MNIAEAKQQIKDTVDGYLDRDDTGAYEIPPESQRPLFLLGAPGIGKTAVVGQVARELGIGLVSYSMTHHTRQSALGLPFIVHKSYGGEEFDVSEYTMSEIIASIYDYMERTGLRTHSYPDCFTCSSAVFAAKLLHRPHRGSLRIPDGESRARFPACRARNALVHAGSLVSGDYDKPSHHACGAQARAKEACGWKRRPGRARTGRRCGRCGT